MRQPLAVGLIIAACALLASDTRAWAQSFSANPVADAFVFAGEPIFDYGGAGVVAVSAPGLFEGEFQSLLRFDLSGAKSNFDATFGAGNWSLSSASLQLASSNPNNSIFNTPAAGQFRASWLENDSWIEGDGGPSLPGTTGVTWNSLPSVLSANDQNLGSFSFDGATGTINSYPLLLSPGLVGDAAAGGLMSIHLQAAPGDTTMSASFNSRNFGTAIRRPLLTLNAIAIPEPATWVLIGVGIAGLGLLRRAAARQS